MKSNRLTLCVTIALLSPLSLLASDIVPKQLAGPPSEFAAMQPADPADAAIYSKSALLPVSMSADKAGGFASEITLPVESDKLRFLVFSGGALDWTTQMRAPSGRSEKAARSLASEVRQAQFGMDNATHPAEYYAFDGIAEGTWNLKLRSTSGAVRDGFVLIEGEASTQLVSYLAHSKQIVGERIGIVASAMSEQGGEVKSGRDAARSLSMSLRVTRPGGAIESVSMLDDGKSGDGAAGDGIFGASFLADKSGNYLAQVRVDGVNLEGRPFVRTSEHPIPIVERSLGLSGNKAVAQIESSGSRLTLNVPVATTEKAQSHYRGFTEVWGTGAAGEAVPVAWVSGMVSPTNGQLGFGLDKRWIALAGARAPFELRNVRFEDTNGYVTVAGAERLPMQMPDLPIEKAKPGSIAIDEAMTMGVRPASLNADKGTGTRLLLVHGYCSGGVWPASQFSNASTFLDANQNRTHDQFARLISSFGSTWNSFGVVAHSQGGAASLHLYNYYWSGLDRATGSRLIQSVGTPYQGTNLAGILATLGSWFGVGCSTNNDLTYSGASAWLAGIPTSSRAKVNYYTTSFRSTNWWTNDYCQFATDLVLSDPEDGTTEQAKGQLSGGVNRGHTTGQCHTANMRDPAQYLDSSRNSTMNANAAR